MQMRYKALKILRRGEILDIDGVSFRMIEGEIEIGDTYIAERNTGPKLLTALKVNKEDNYIIPKENAYPFDIHECVKVDLV